MTHLVYAFAHVNADGSVSVIEWDDVDVYDATAGLYYRVNVGLKALNPALKTLISVGGADSAPMFVSVMANGTARAALVSNLVAFARLHGFDGVDVDWCVAVVGVGCDADADVGVAVAVVVGVGAPRRSCRRLVTFLLLVVAFVLRVRISYSCRRCVCFVTRVLHAVGVVDVCMQ